MKILVKCISECRNVVEELWEEVLDVDNKEELLKEVCSLIKSKSSRFSEIGFVEYINSWLNESYESYEECVKGLFEDEDEDNSLSLSEESYLNFIII